MEPKKAQPAVYYAAVIQKLIVIFLHSINAIRICAVAHRHTAENRRGKKIDDFFFLFKTLNSDELCQFFLCLYFSRTTSFDIVYFLFYIPSLTDC